jgi:hypothetical protein
VSWRSGCASRSCRCDRGARRQRRRPQPVGGGQARAAGSPSRAAAQGGHGSNSQRGVGPACVGLLGSSVTLTGYLFAVAHTGKFVIPKPVSTDDDTITSAKDYAADRRERLRQASADAA